MATNLSLKFGYYPESLDLSSGSISIATLLDLPQTVANINGSDGVYKGWIYAPPQQVRDLSGSVSQRPYPCRIFGLPKTHVIEHASPDSNDHLLFHLWTLSFFTGIRLTSDDAGMLDATTIKPGTFVDFVLLGRGLPDAITLAENFWKVHQSKPERARLFAAAVHALFLGQNPQLLQFERFLMYYTAFDTCFALTKQLQNPNDNIPHAKRVAWMCSLFNMPIPAWADPAQPTESEVPSIRNATIHEALFMDAPLGFAIHGAGTGQNITLEMHSLICRLLVAILGGDQTSYVVSPVTTRQRSGLTLC